ncbi:hypothetical protein GQ457_03G046840 [Hibiscus cannabinus]
MEIHFKNWNNLASRAFAIDSYTLFFSSATCWGRNASGGKSSNNKMRKQAALAFAKRTLDQCHKFEDTGKSCFNEPMFRDMLLSGFFLNDGESGKPCSNNSIRSLEARNSGPNGDNYAVKSPDLLPPINQLLLEDAVGGTSSAQSSIGSPLSSSTKGKRSERDREGKGHGRELKAKPKQKTTQPSVSVNGLLGKMSEQPKTSSSVSKLSEITVNDNAREKDEFSLDVLDDLQLPGQDLGSWLNIDDDGLQDHDFMGLEIPMDDLSDLNMMAQIIAENICVWVLAEEKARV